MTELRNVEQRKADVLESLESHNDLWLATSGESGKPHLIAVSAWWDGKDLVVATQGKSITAANLRGGRAVRLAAGSPANAIVIDAEVADTIPAREAPAGMGDGFSSAVGWDPRQVGEGWVFYRLKLSRVQAYRGYHELEGRDVMRKSQWLA